MMKREEGGLARDDNYDTSEKPMVRSVVSKFVPYNRESRAIQRRQRAFNV
jgi:hypothetical protein